MIRELGQSDGSTRNLARGIWVMVTNWRRSGVSFVSIKRDLFWQYKGFELIWL
jgi:hypothetical protein